MSTVSLEKDITTALADNDIGSISLAALISETETAITEADATAKAEREKALNPALSPDAKAAREAMQAAEFARDRLRTTLPKLQQRLTAVEASEYAHVWDARYQQAAAKVDEAAKKFARYPALAAEIIGMFRAAEEIDREISRVNGSAPPNEPRRLRGPELVARGLQSFSSTDPPIPMSVELVDWEHSNRTVWPPRRSPDLSVMPVVSHPGADWAAQQGERAEAKRRENERVMAYYETMARQREEREHAAARLPTP